MACPGAPRNCASARPSGTARGKPAAQGAPVAAPGISRMPADQDERNRSIAEQRNSADRAELREARARGDHQEARPDRNQLLEHLLLVAALSARAGDAFAASSAGSQPATIAIEIPATKNPNAAAGATRSPA